MEDQGKLNFRQTLSALLRSNRRHVRYIQALACLALIVAVAVPLSMRQSGVAMSTTETRLSCHYSGSGAHTHNADCYDADGNLVCPLEEKAFHTHTDECYATERVLVCGQEETAGHTHSASCYDAEGNLTCTLTEEPAHKHTDACYEERITDELVCGLEETAEEHVHGPACFETVTVQVADTEAADEDSPVNTTATVEGTPEEDPTPAQEFTGTLKQKDENGNEYVTLVAQVKAPQGALPKGSTMRVEAVDLQARDAQDVPDGPTVQDKLNEALRTEAGDTAAFTQTDAVDITFYDEQGNRIDPANKVEVRITTSMIREFSDQRTANDEAVANNSLLVLHVVDKQHTTRTDAPDAEVMRDVYLINQDEHDTTTGHENTIVFEADEFSAYVVARVDNAHVAPEAEPVVADPAELAEAEAKAADEATTEAADKAEATEAADPAEAKDAAKASDPTHPAQSFTHRFTGKGGKALLRVDVAAPEGAFPAGTTMKVAWVDTVEVEDAVTEAVAERTDGKLLGLCAVDITFYDPEGNEIEPAKKITVTFGSDFIDTEDDSYVVHIDDKGKGEVVDALGAKELEKREIADQADELVFESDAFSTYVVAVTTLRKELAASDGKTYDISVDAPAEAGIPQDAELRVSEIVEGDEGYAEYLAQAIETAGLSSAEEASYARFFDIEIWSGDQKIEPSGDVQVSIKLMDTPADQLDSIKIVHFSDDGTELVLPERFTVDGQAELSFTTDSFSVYSVVSADSIDVNNLNGREFVLVCDPDAPTTSAPNPPHRALMANEIRLKTWTDNQHPEYDEEWRYSKYLDAKGVAIETLSDGTKVVGGNASVWKFEHVSGNQYRLSSEGHYLTTVDRGGPQQSPYDQQGLALTNNQSQASLVTVNKHGDQVELLINNQPIVNRNITGYWWGDKRGFDVGVPANNNRTQSDQEGDTEYGFGRYFTLAELTEEYDEFKATKVAVTQLGTDEDGNSTLTYHIDEDGNSYADANQPIIIYRKDADGNLWALANDGTYVELTESGDSVYWRRQGKNIVWNLKIHGASVDSKTEGYYELYSDGGVDDQGKRQLIYIAPQLTGENGQVFQVNEEIGLALNGRKDGEYASTILAWDDPNYEWVGVGMSDSGVAYPVDGNLSPEFMFAIMDTTPVDDNINPETVATVDSASMGIKINMYNFSGAMDDNATRVYAMTDVIGSDTFPSQAPTTITHVVGSLLGADGFPVSTAGHSVKEIFDGSANQKYNWSHTYASTETTGVNHLFIQSTYDETGYFRYSSQENFAELSGNDFTVYRQVATPELDPRNDHTYFYHGHFMPYNHLDMSKDSSITNIYDQDGNRILLEDPRAYEHVYGLREAGDFFFGMTMEAPFQQRKDGIAKNGEHTVYKFTGDDDLWVYIDGVLVLDLGGIHEAVSGEIDFATGVVTVNGEVAGTIRSFFEAAVQNATGEQRTKIQSIIDNMKGNTFADFSTHKFNMFYMERGAGASNLDLKFNLDVVEEGTFTVAKELSEPAQGDYTTAEFLYRAYLADGTIIKPDTIKNGTIRVTAKKTNHDKTVTELTASDFSSDGVFKLKPDESVTFKLEGESVVDPEYYVEELGVDTSLFTKVSVLEDVDASGNLIPPMDIASASAYNTDASANSMPQYPSNIADGHTYRSLTKPISQRSTVTYENTPKTEELHIYKKVVDQDGVELHPDDTVQFEFKVYFEDQSGAIVPYNQGPYYLTKTPADGKLHYYTIGLQNGKTLPIDQGYVEERTEEGETVLYFVDTNGDSKRVVPHPIDPTEEIPEGCTTLPICGVSGQSGSIAKIPEGYKVSIEGLLPGTQFYVEERQGAGKIPAGYSYKEKIINDETCIVPGMLPVNVAEITPSPNQADGIIKLDSNAEVQIVNLYERAKINVEKEWKNGITTDAKVKVTLGRYRLLKEGETIPAAGALVIKDSVMGLEDADASFEYATYTVFDRNTGELVATQKGKGAVNLSIDLPAGRYTVNKTVATPTGYELKSASQISKVAEVHSDDSFVVEFDKTIFEKEGSTPSTHTLTIHDSYAGLDDGESYVATYTVYDNNYNQVAAPTYGPSVSGATVQLPAGTYHVEKTVTVPDGYTANIISQTVNNVTVDADKTIDFNKTTFTKQASTATLQITDSFSGIETGYNATYTVTDQNGTAVATKTWAEDAENGAITVTGLTIGQTYIVSKIAADIQGYTKSNGTESKNVIIGDGTNSVTLGPTSYTSQSGKTTFTIHIDGNGQNGWFAQIYNVFFDGVQQQNLNTFRNYYSENLNSDIQAITFEVRPGTHVTMQLNHSQGASVTARSGSEVSIDNSTPKNVSFTASGSNVDIDVTWGQSTRTSMPSRQLRSMSFASPVTEPVVMLAASEPPAANNTRGTSTTYSRTFEPDISGEGIPAVPDGYTGWAKDTSYAYTVELENPNWSELNIPVDKVDENGNAYIYYVKSVEETGLEEGTTVTYPENLFISTDGTGSFKVTNTIPAPVPTSVIIKKADADTMGEGQTVKYLDGAVFQLQMADGSSWVTPTSVTVDGVTIASNGQFTIPAAGITLGNLTTGTYQLKEISAPAGYNFIVGAPVTFVVNNKGEITSTAGTIDGVKYTAATETVLAQFVIPNPPGSELPETGGPGTILYTLCGIAMIAAAGYIGFVSRRKARKEDA